MKIDKVRWYHTKYQYPLVNILSWPDRKDPYIYKSGYSGITISKRAWIVSPFTTSYENSGFRDVYFFGEYSYYFTVCFTAYRTFEEIGYYLHDVKTSAAPMFSNGSFSKFHYYSSSTGKSLYFTAGTEGEQILNTLNKHKNSENIETRLNDLKNEKKQLEDKL